MAPTKQAPDLQYRNGRQEDDKEIEDEWKFLQQTTHVVMLEDNVELFSYFTQFNCNSLRQEAVEVRRLLLILSTFDMLTGLKLNLDKSSMISVGKDIIVKYLAMEFWIKVEVLPIKYLGLPLGITAKNATIWEDVIQRMEKKLALGKRRYLDKAGRLTLLKSYLASFPLYYLSLIRLPAAVEQKLTRIMRSFLWDSSEDKRKMCWVSWKKICTPLNKGGLGVKNLKLTNFALLSKWVWRYTNEKNVPWRRIVQEKFKAKKKIFFPVDDNLPQGKEYWKNILKPSSLVKRKCEIQVKNGKAVRL
ncbi:uncharacterized protein LOC113324745 [Papaver somniferum]|uniref:uncharacterized protein LOC113324745 n=1 Tax=Papaver somniferum TaxID=3469 RepID=UPI000E6FD981|nr:uncharacterized protein LOC113324745 [Papaver somniferum]